MALAFDAASSGNAALTTSISWSHTASGSNRIVIVGINFNAAVTSISVTYGGNAMTLIRTDSNVTLWQLIAPPTGSQTVAASWTTSVFAEGGAVSLTGAAQTSPVGTTGTTTAASTTSVSLAISTATANSFVVSFAGTDNALYASVSATGTNQTLRVSSKGSGQIWEMISTQTTTSAGSYTAGFSGATFSTTWTMQSAEIKESTGGGTTTSSQRMMMGMG